MSNCGDNCGACCRRLWLRAFPLGFKQEFLHMLSLAWPAILTTFFQFFLQTTSIIMCGHLSKIDLDGVALACSFINVAGISIGLGMSTGCDTLFSQTYGSTNKKRMGMYLQRSLMVMYFAMGLLWCLHLNIRPVLLWLQQDPEISERAAQYMLYFMPGLFFDYTFLVLSRYLQNQNVMYPPMVAGFIGNVFNVASQYIALHVLGLGFLWSAILQASSLAVMFILTLSYILVSRIYENSWDGWKLEALYDWWDFIKLAVPGIFLIALEKWSFEVSIIVAGALGDVQLGIQSVLFQIECISYMIPLGMSVAVNIRVGQQLGAKQPVGAAQAYRVGVVMVVMAACGTATVYATCRDILPKIFTSDAEIVAQSSDILPILGVFLLSDGIAATSSGAIRGCGRQLQGAALMFIGFYVLGLPTGIPLALFTDLQVLGMWLGLLVGITVEAAAFCVLVLRLNWQQEVQLAQRRAFGYAPPAPGDSAEGDARAMTETETEFSALLSPKHQVTFYSEPESCEKLQQRRRGRRRVRNHFEGIHTGRFFSTSLSRVAEVEEEAAASELPPLRPVLLQRLLAVGLLLLLLAASVMLRIYTDAAVPAPGNFDNCTVTADTMLSDGGTADTMLSDGGTADTMLSDGGTADTMLSDGGTAAAKLQL